jgi:hypothetical protein
MTDLVVAKFGGTSVADFDAMNRSIDVALLDANTRIVVLSASAGVTNILGLGWRPLLPVVGDWSVHHSLRGLRQLR